MTAPLAQRIDAALAVLVDGCTADEAADADTLRDAATICGWWARQLVELSQQAADQHRAATWPALFAVSEVTG